MKELEFIYKRRSVRKFKDTDKPIPKEHLEEIIKAAVAAPSGKNLQNWHFVVITSKDKIQEIVRIVENKNAALAGRSTDPGQAKAIKALLPYHTVFKDAPVFVLAYAGPYPVLADQLLKSGVISEETAIKYRKPNQAIQNISAAMENLLLAAANLGYGGCWMAGPTYADEEISAYIEFDKIVGKADYFLAAMTPLGVPAQEPGLGPMVRGRKPLSEVLSIIE